MEGGRLAVAGKSTGGRWNSFGGRLRVGSCWRVGGERKSDRNGEQKPQVEGRGDKRETRERGLSEVQ